MMEALSFSESSVLKEPHSVTSQKTPFFIVAAVKPSNLTKVTAVFGIKTGNSQRQKASLAFAQCEIWCVSRVPHWNRCRQQRFCIIAKFRLQDFVAICSCIPHEVPVDSASTFNV
jgi:hypothetical protein